MSMSHRCSGVEMQLGPLSSPTISVGEVPMPQRKTASQGSTSIAEAFSLAADQFDGARSKQTDIHTTHSITAHTTFPCVVYFLVLKPAGF